MNEVVGQRFGRLTVLSVHSERHKWPSHQKVICQCDCGGSATPTLTKLRNGHTKSCGCLSREKASIRLKELSVQYQRKFPDPSALVGQRFGRLEILGIYPEEPSRPSGQKMLCRCDCGRETTPRMSSLLLKNTRSCGCLRLDLIQERHARIRLASGISPGLKRCSKCNEIKITEEFKINGKRPSSWCHQCAREQRWLREYGVTPEQYEQMAADGCNICGSVSPKRNGHNYLHVDHNHETGMVAGVLCHPCNIAIGYLQESPEIIEKALAYIHRKQLHSARSEDGYTRRDE